MNGALRSLRHRNFRVYFIGQLVSWVGTWMQMMAQSWLVYRLTSSAWLLGLIAFASQAPFIVFGFFGGAVADRFDKRKLLLVTQTLCLLQAAALAWLTLRGVVTVWEVFVLALFAGVVNAFDMPARQAIVVELVDREDLGNAIALNSVITNASRLVGPAIAGLVVAAWGEGADFALNALSYVASLWTLAIIALPARRFEPSAGVSKAVEDVREGLRYAFGDPSMRVILILLGCLSLGGIPYLTLMPVFADGVLHSGARGLGLLMAAVGVGSVVGSFTLARLRTARGLPRLVAAAGAAFGVGIAAFAASKRMDASLLAMAAAGWAMTTSFAGCNTLLQIQTSDEMRGRVMAIFSMSFMAIGPVANLIAGAAAERLGAPATVGVGGLGCVAAAVWFLLRASEEGSMTRPARGAAVAGLAGALLLASPSVRAQEAPPTLPEPAPAPEAAPAKVLTWDDCVALALRKSPDLLSSLSAAQAAKYGSRGSYNGLFPSLTLSNGYSDSSANTSGDKWTAQLQANAQLFNAGTIASIKSASAAYGQAQASERLTSASVRFSLRQAFAQVLFAERSVDVDRNIRDMRANGARLVTLRYDSGRESKGNMLRANAQLAQAEADLRQAERALRADQKALDRELGLDDFQDILATGALVAQDAPAAPGDENALLSRRPDVAVQEAAVRGAQAAVESARATLYPSLSGSYTRARGPGRAEFPNAVYSWVGGLTLSYSLFGAGPTSTYYAIKSANQSLERARQDLRTVRDAAVADLESSWSSYAGAVDQVAVQHALLAAARQRNDEADVRYASGLLTYDNWEIIATDRINSERQAVSADFNAVVQQAAWERSIGRQLGE